MAYATEFPNMGEDTACAAMAADSASWEDTSWGNDQCPSFTCDVFVLWCDHESPAQREFPHNPRFMLTDEGRVVLETDDFADVMAFQNDGKRDFPAWDYAARLAALIAEEEASPRPCPDYLAFLRSNLETPAYAPEEDAALKDAWDKA